MKPLNPYSLRKVVTISMFAIFLVSSLFFQNCGGPVDKPSTASQIDNSQVQR